MPELLHSDGRLANPIDKLTFSAEGNLCDSSLMKSALGLKNLGLKLPQRSQMKLAVDLVRNVIHAFDAAELESGKVG